MKPLPATAFSLSNHPPTEKELKFPGLCMQNRFDRPELQLERPDEHAPLSAHAQKLLEREKDDKELLKEQQEAFNRAKNGGYWGGKDSSSSSSSSRGGFSATGANALPVGGGSPAAAAAAATAAAAADESLNFCGKKRAPLERYGIYDGIVTRIMEYGAFVQLDLAEGRREGLLHAADMSRPDGGPCVSAYAFDSHPCSNSNRSSNSNSNSNSSSSRSSRSSNNSNSRNIIQLHRIGRYSRE